MPRPDQWQCFGACFGRVPRQGQLPLEAGIHIHINKYIDGKGSGMG